MESTNMPLMIMTITVSLIILGVGMFMFFFVLNTTETEVNSNFVEAFEVTDPNVNQTLTLGSPSSQVNLVRFYNGTAWRVIPAAGYTAGEYTIEVDHAYLY